MNNKIPSEHGDGEVGISAANRLKTDGAADGPVETLERSGKIEGTARGGRRVAQTSDAVTVRVEDIVFPTYLPAAPDKNPMFLEKRVYQGSSGAIYPLPFTDRISETKTDRKWKVVWIENAFVRVMILPEIGGRIHAIQDKASGCDLIYNQHVIKPALVGLAGPWVSGGIEFNWPQHHRPSTFLPADVEIQEHADGSKTVWCGDHDPILRLKGMHGICLYPDRTYVELKARACNRTPFVQTFLWWANAATQVHEAYQSFFPPDVDYVADHARRSMSEYPLAQGLYYGVNYGERGRNGIPPGEAPRQYIPPHCANKNGKTDPRLPNYAPNDLRFYGNIPVPTSYMCMGSREDFFGGYDFKAEAGIVHIASHHIAPGKKQWTWGNHEFGYAWDRNLTDADQNGEFPPYIEIMSGVYTDNQPDFSFLQPGETKTWSQYWYPIQKIGPATHANLDAALGWHFAPGELRFGISVTANQPKAVITVSAKGSEVARFVRDLSPGNPLVEAIALPPKVGEKDLKIFASANDGRELIAYEPKPRVKGRVPPPATEPLAPEKISSSDELFITGLHLDQYRHATRSPVIYWREALRRDPLDSRCNNAMGKWHLRRGEFTKAESHFRKAIERLTIRNANPADGEAFYNLGLCLRFLGRDDEAYDPFYKATWNQAWAGAAFHALGEIDCVRKNWDAALDHLNRSLRLNADNLRARNLKAVVLRKLERDAEADTLLRETLELDPLDWWARALSLKSGTNGQKITCDLQTRLDIAHDLARAGLYAEAVEWLKNGSAPTRDLPDQNWGATPMVLYTLGWLHEKLGQDAPATEFYHRAAAEPPDYCFPARLEEILVLGSAICANPKDGRAAYYLGNLLYDRRRHEEAIQLWEKAAKLDPGFSIVWRNLGIGWFNILKKPVKAKAAYEKAFAANRSDARLLFERDQLWKRLGEKPEKRLRELEKYPDLVSRRDDLSVELCSLYNQTGRPEKVLEIVAGRKFQPWEGGEGAALGQHTRTHVALGRTALMEGKFDEAKAQFELALAAPENLGEARHLLANHSDIHFWLGCAINAAGDKKSAREHWLAAANFKGDFQEMRVQAFSEMTFWSAMSREKLGQKQPAKKLLRDSLKHALELQKAKARIEYFATSLPAMLLFEDDLQFRQETTALFMQAQARFGTGKIAAAKRLLREVLRRDPNHALAADFAASLPLLEKPAKMKTA